MRDNWEKIGIKHLIECHCTLKIYEGKPNHIFHKFPVYSIFDSDRRVIEKISQCNNCETLHKVHDICKSEIIRSGKDRNVAAISKEDMMIELDNKLVNTLIRYNCDISTWEHVLDIIEKEAWGYPVIVSREVIEGQYHNKILLINSESKFKITTKKIEDEIVLKRG